MRVVTASGPQEGAGQVPWGSLTPSRGEPPPRGAASRGCGGEPACPAPPKLHLPRAGFWGGAMPSPPPPARLLAPLRGWGQVRDPPRPRCLPLPRPLLAALGPSPPHPRAPPAWAGSCPSRAAPGAGADTGGEPSSPPAGSRGWPPSPLCSSCPRRHLLPASRGGWGGPARSKGHFGGGLGGSGGCWPLG